jgi:hypothetical protein
MASSEPRVQISTENEPQFSVETMGACTSLWIRKGHGGVGLLLDLRCQTSVSCTGQAARTLRVNEGASS